MPWLPGVVAVELEEGGELVDVLDATECGGDDSGGVASMASYATARRATTLSGWPSGNGITLKERRGAPGVRAAGARHGVGDDGGS